MPARKNLTQRRERAQERLDNPDLEARKKRAKQYPGRDQKMVGK